MLSYYAVNHGKLNCFNSWNRAKSKQIVILRLDAAPTLKSTLEKEDYLLPITSYLLLITCLIARLMTAQTSDLWSTAWRRQRWQQTVDANTRGCLAALLIENLTKLTLSLIKVAKGTKSGRARSVRRPEFVKHSNKCVTRVLLLLWWLLLMLPFRIASWSTRFPRGVVWEFKTTDITENIACNSLLHWQLAERANKNSISNNWTSHRRWAHSACCLIISLASPLTVLVLASPVNWRLIEWKFERRKRERLNTRDTSIHWDTGQVKARERAF